MAIAGIGILLFHLWVPVFPYGTAAGTVERFLVSVGYVGVDVFFFVSAYTLSLRPVYDCRGFLWDRLWKLLPLFLTAWALGKFLWFVPALLVVYVLFPPLYRLCRPHPVFSALLLLLAWAALVVLAEGWLQPERDVGIFLFRIPVILLGAYGAALEGKLSPRRKGLWGLGLLAAGVPLLVRFASLHKLREPFQDTFYLTVLPAALGILLLTDWLSDRLSCPPLERLGAVTLELYFMQLAAGGALIEFFLGLTHSRLVTDIFVMAAVIAASLGLGAALGWLRKRNPLRRLVPPKTP